MNFRIDIVLPPTFPVHSLLAPSGILGRKYHGMTSYDIFQRASKVETLRLFCAHALILDGINGLDVLHCETVVASAVATSRLMWVMRLGLTRAEVMDSDDLAIVFQLALRAIHPPAALAYLLRQCYHVESSRFGAPALQPSRCVARGARWKGTIFPGDSNILVIANVISRLIYASTEPRPAINFIWRRVDIVVFTKTIHQFGFCPMWTTVVETFLDFWNNNLYRESYLASLQMPLVVDLLGTVQTFRLRWARETISGLPG